MPPAEIQTLDWLPDIDSVEVVVIDHIYPNRVSLYMQEAQQAPKILILGAEALRIADLWRRLPPGEQSRCHTPPYGLRFLVGGRVICEASVCWECDNIFGQADGKGLHFAFNSRSEIAQDLLTEVTKAAAQLKED